MEVKSLVIDNILINYLQQGNLGENTPVFLHGWGSRASHFKIILKNCANFVALDLPGFGESDAPKGAWGTYDYVEFLRKFLEKLKINNPILVGHSFGGSIAIKYCADYGNVRKLILVSGAGIREGSLKTLAYKIFSKFFKAIFSLPGLNLFKNKIRSVFYKKIGAEDYFQAGELKEGFKKIIREDLKEDMKKIKTETAIIWGENDKDTLLQNGRLINTLIKNSRIYIIKNAGHFVFIDQPEEFKKILEQELKI